MTVSTGFSPHSHSLPVFHQQYYSGIVLAYSFSCCYQTEIIKYTVAEVLLFFFSFPSERFSSTMVLVMSSVLT